jgi:hypothetical protein
MIEQIASLITVGFSVLATVFIVLVASSAAMRFFETVTED